LFCIFRCDSVSTKLKITVNSHQKFIISTNYSLSRWARFSARPDWPCGPHSLLYNGYLVFSGGKVRPGVLLSTQTLLVPRSWKSKDVPLPTLWATTRPVSGTLYLALFIIHYSIYRPTSPPTVIQKQYVQTTWELNW